MVAAAWVAASAALATFCVLAAAAWYAKDSAKTALQGLDDARRTRHAALITDLSRRWDEPLIADSRKLFGQLSREDLVGVVERVYRPISEGRSWWHSFLEAVFVAEDTAARQLADFQTLTAWPNLIETIGVLEADGAISQDVIHQMWGGGIIGAWDGWRDAIRAMRTHSGRPTTYQNFERLYDAMMNLEPGRVSAQESGHPASRGAAPEADQSGHQ